MKVRMQQMLVRDGNWVNARTRTTGLVGEGNPQDEAAIGFILFF